MRGAKILFNGKSLHSSTGATLNKNTYAMAGTEQSVADFGVFYDTIRAGFWGPEAAARVAVWGLPMVVLAIISAVTQPAPR